MPESHSVDSISQLLLPELRLTYPPHHSTYPALTAEIADLQLHPTIEAILHLLNGDLPSAHFLLRRLQAPPAVEGMLLHGILHRAEGNLDNARAWFVDVQDACEGWVPKKKGDGQTLDRDVLGKLAGGEGVSGSLINYVYGPSDLMQLVNHVELFRHKKPRDICDGEEEEITQGIRDEMERMLEWCKHKFGVQRWPDASGVWVKDSQEINKLSNDMVSGDKGQRKF